MRLKTRWSDWESDGPGPYSFALVLGKLLRGLRLKGLITAEPDTRAFRELMQECYLALTEPEEWWAEIPTSLHTGYTPQMAEVDEKIHQRFHQLWTAAGTTHYEKAEWNELYSLLVQRGVRV
ncbi:MAG: hypothetical protein RQ745_08395 [Longimicrobiales bacterium]|nr:hypothetical protein [Longimicrobiales bacterium]